MKKLLSFLLVLSLMLTIGAGLPMSTAAKTEGIWEYDSMLADGKTITTIKGCTDPFGELTIPETIAGKTVNSISADAFKDCTQITEIYLPDTIETINWSAFAGCTSLTSITIPDSVTVIGREAFQDCIALAEINLSANLTTVEQDAFDNTAYYNNEANWKNDALYLDYVLLDVRSGPKELVIQEGTRIFTSTALFTAGSIRSITIPDSMEYIPGAFGFGFGYVSATEYKVSDTNENFSVVDGILYDKSGKTIICYPRGKEETEYTIPDGVEKIDNNAFYLCKKLEQIHIPDSVTEIGSNAFSYCPITSIELPDGLCSLGASAFYYCKSLTNVTLPDGIEQIDMFTFASCTALTDVTISDLVSEIHYTAFSGVENVTIHGYAGSKAERFAANEEIPFVALPGEVLGDVDFNGTIDVADIIKVKDLIMREDWTHKQRRAGDMNTSRTLEVGDIMGIKNLIMGA